MSKHDISISIELQSSKSNGVDSGETNGANTAAEMSKDSEVVDINATDRVLASKMSLVNSALDEIGMTRFHWKLFFVLGFGYAADSALIVCHSIAQTAVTQQYGAPNKRIKGIALASQIGLLVGAAAWGFTADIIGRKIAFNTSLFLCAIFVLVAGGMPNYLSFAAMVALYSAGAGGNYILDATNFLEFLPASHAWLVTFLAVWWGVGYTITGLLAWAFMGKFSCPSGATAETCTNADNMGWRYLHVTIGALVLVFSILRVSLVKMPQTPKWLISQNRDAEAFKELKTLSNQYGRPITLTCQDLQAQGQVLHTEKSVWSAFRLMKHFGGLFETKMLAYSTVIIIANWFIIGMVSPLYSVFLPYYLESRGAHVGAGSVDITWRNYAINHVVGLAGPITAAVLVETRLLGRRGTLAIGAASTMALQFGYTQIKTPTQNLAVSATITAASNIYYGTIYAYTPEILPSAHRATGYGLCVVMNRVGGIIGVLIGSFANVETTAPLFVCAGLFGLLIVLSLALPFESRGKRSA